MTDNEKRAHDLAIAVIPFIYEAFKSQAIQSAPQSANSEVDIHFDFYAEYIKTYKTALKSFKRDFPE